MDIQKIIDRSLNETNEEFGDNPNFQFMGSSSKKDCIVPHKMIKFYSERLLENYHAELKNLLAGYGIHI
ncbi:MAG: hypothetical protein HFI88_10035 [Lachnospiraceae bacterium]|nr:hypothetical protein [Lachnospiraceae bacterium]